ncbi:MAG TPA: RodZ domain-containing protein [Marinagarivorans sp.]
MTSQAHQSPTVGQKLSEARKQSGKTLAQIAQATRIFESRLEAIERDDYSAAGTAPAFVIGYVKTYAKLVGVAEKPLVKELEAYYHARKLAEEREAPVVVKKAKVNWMPWAATVIALAIFVGLGQWLFALQQGQRLDDGAKTNPSDNASQAIIDSSVASVSNRETTTPLTQRDSNLMPKSMSEPDSTESEAPDAPAPLVKPKVNTGTASSIAEFAREIASVEPESANDSAAGNNENNESAEPSDAVAGSDTLALQFTGDCWVEIYDAKGIRRVARLAQAGGQVQLTGLAPFDVKLGDATVATGYVNGRSIDLTPRPGRRVLRIQVGP